MPTTLNAWIKDWSPTPAQHKDKKHTFGLAGGARSTRGGGIRNRGAVGSSIQLGGSRGFDGPPQDTQQPNDAAELSYTELTAPPSWSWAHPVGLTTQELRCRGRMRFLDTFVADPRPAYKRGSRVIHNRIRLGAPCR